MSTGQGTATGRTYGPARPSGPQNEAWQATGQQAGRKKTRWSQPNTAQNNSHTPAVDQHDHHYGHSTGLHSPVGNIQAAGQNAAKLLGQARKPKDANGPHPPDSSRDPGGKKPRRTPRPSGRKKKTLLDKIREDFDTHWKHMHIDIASRLECECRKQRRNYFKQIRAGNQANPAVGETDKEKPVNLNVQLNKTLQILREAGLGNLADPSNADSSNGYYTSQG